jgi:acyl-CoA thioester hydrolase
MRAIPRRDAMKDADGKQGDWDLPSPHVLTVQVSDADIDAYEHVNNAVYVTWCDRAAWDHSAHLGLPLERCLELDRGMAVLRSVIMYLRPALRDEIVNVATWLLPSESKLRIGRRFHMRRAVDGATLVRAEIDYACIELSTGRPTRWPAEFKDLYVVDAGVQRALSSLAAI